MLAEYRLKQGEFELEQQEAQAPEDDAGRRRSTARRSSCSPTSSCPTICEQALENGATGVGLFRSEFLFLNRAGSALRGRAVRGLPPGGAGMEGRPVTIRTFDLGADKHKEGLDGLVARRAESGARACARSASAWPSRSCS